MSHQPLYEQACELITEYNRRHARARLIHVNGDDPDQVKVLELLLIAEQFVRNVHATHDRHRDRTPSCSDDRLTATWCNTDECVEIVWCADCYERTDVYDGGVLLVQQIGDQLCADGEMFMAELRRVGGIEVGLGEALPVDGEDR